ncbi:MAG: hypothetical protein J3R72DRAFT_147398 [Linnemannia gamsii]|nr:MAG: hypothetical protein J3R72DRAFT_147398 [Linnemannia gamsii]
MTSVFFICLRLFFFLKSYAGQQKKGSMRVEQKSDRDGACEVQGSSVVFFLSFVRFCFFPFYTPSYQQYYPRHCICYHFITIINTNQEGWTLGLKKAPINYQQPFFLSPIHGRH